MAHHQDHFGSAAADHGRPLSLQHARLSGEEAAGGLKWGRGGRRFVSEMPRPSEKAHLFVIFVFLLKFYSACIFN